MEPSTPLVPKHLPCIFTALSSSSRVSSGSLEKTNSRWRMEQGDTSVKRTTVGRTRLSSNLIFSHDGGPCFS
ncbi:hypothetical protein T439DRAFT_324974 [Meredithblackwellia eburnea MCA 4105]